MRPSILLVTALAASGAHASWFGSDKPEYNSWDEGQLKAWLQAHNIQPPSSYTTPQLQDLVKSNWDGAYAWTADQYAKAQKAFVDVKDDTFASWDESRLREFLLDQGVVEPKGTREQLAVLARQKYRAYTSYASSVSSSLSTRASTAVYGDRTQQASKSATSAYTVASGSASSAYSVASGSASSAYSEASSTVSSVIAQATTEVARTLDDSKDYVYSTWDDSRLRQFLQDKGLVEPKVETTREQLLRKMRTAYAAPGDVAYNAWADSYIRHWLLAHGLVSSSDPSTDTEEFRNALADNLTRESLTAKMSHYYYNTKDTVFSTWSDSDLHTWLVNHGIVKSDAQIKRDKLVKMVNDNYVNAQDTVWSAWTDSQMRDWLIDHGYLRTDAQKNRDQLIKLMNEKYEDASAKSASYLVWPDARLRAYLRNRGVSEDAIPTTRPGLLQEVRIRWIQTQTKAEGVLNQITAAINSGFATVEEKIGEILALITGTTNSASEKARAGYEDAKAYAHEKEWDAKAAGYDASAGWEDAKGAARSKTAQASGTAAANKEWLKGKVASAAAEAEKATAHVKHEL